MGLGKRKLYSHCFEHVKEDSNSGKCSFKLGNACKLLTTMNVVRENCKAHLNPLCTDAIGQAVAEFQRMTCPQNRSCAAALSDAAACANCCCLPIVFNHVCSMGVPNSEEHYKSLVHWQGANEVKKWLPRYSVEGSGRIQQDLYPSTDGGAFHCSRPLMDTASLVLMEVSDTQTMLYNSSDSIQG